MTEQMRKRRRSEEGGVQLGNFIAQQLQPLLSAEQADQARRRVWAQITTDILAEAGHDVRAQRPALKETAVHDSERARGVA